MSKKTLVGAANQASIGLIALVWPTYVFAQPASADGQLILQCDYNETYQSGHSDSGQRIFTIGPGLWRSWVFETSQWGTSNFCQSGSTCEMTDSTLSMATPEKTTHVHLDNVLGAGLDWDDDHHESDQTLISRNNGSYYYRDDDHITDSITGKSSGDLWSERKGSCHPVSDPALSVQKKF